MLGTVNSMRLLSLITACTIFSACSDPTSPTPAPRPSTPSGQSAGVDSATSGAATPTSFPDGPPVGDSIEGLAFLRDGAIWQSIDTSSTPTRLLQPSTQIYAAAVSRSGLIAFVPGTTNQVCIAASSAPQPRCVSPGYYTISGLAWSPDGTQVVFSGEPVVAPCGAIPPCLAARMDLLVLSVSSMAVTPLVVARNGSYAQGASWSPDGSVIAFAMDGGISLVNAAGSQRRVLKSDVGELYAVRGVSWSPDGGRFAVSLDATDACPWLCDTAVGTVDADGSGLRVIATATAATNQFVGRWPHGAPVWSPDGSRIAFGRSDCSGDWDPCHEQEWVVDAKGGAPVQLLEGATLLAWQDR